MPYRLTVHVSHAGSRYAAVDVQLDYQPLDPRQKKQRRSRRALLTVPRAAPAVVYHRMVLAALTEILGVEEHAALSEMSEGVSTRSDQLWLISETDAKLAGRREGRGRAASEPRAERGTTRQ